MRRPPNASQLASPRTHATVAPPLAQRLVRRLALAARLAAGLAALLPPRLAAAHAALPAALLRRHPQDRQAPAAGQGRRVPVALLPARPADAAQERRRLRLRAQAALRALRGRRVVASSARYWPVGSLRGRYTPRSATLLGLDFDLPCKHTFTATSPVQQPALRARRRLVVPGHAYAAASSRRSSAGDLLQEPALRACRRRRLSPIHAHAAASTANARRRPSTRACASSASTPAGPSTRIPPARRRRSRAGDLWQGADVRGLLAAWRHLADLMPTLLLRRGTFSCTSNSAPRPNGAPRVARAGGDALHSSFAPRPPPARQRAPPHTHLRARANAKQRHPAAPARLDRARAAGLPISRRRVSLQLVCDARFLSTFVYVLLLRTP